MDANTGHISQREFETIERYLQGSMDHAEHAAFEKRMARDEALRQSVATYKELIEGVETASLKERLNAFHAEMPETVLASEATDKPKSRSYIKYLAAASVVLIIGVVVWLFAFQQSPQEKLFTAYFKPDPGLITPMGSTNHYDFYAGMIDYKRDDYRQAIKKWKPLLQDHAQSDTLNYFLGVAQLARGDEDKALPYLKKTVKSPGSAFIHEAYFYLGLAYLKEDNRKAAIQALQKSHSDRAGQLLAELEDNS